LIHVDSDEARRQQQRKQRERMGHRKSITNVDSDDDDVDSPRSSVRRSTLARRPTMANVPKKALRNQFNFSERAAQTANNPYRQRQVQTVEPPRLDVCLTANQWVIYDAYQKDLARQQAEKEKANKKSSRKTDSKESALAKKLAELELEKQLNQNDDLGRISKASKIVERMINQNTFNDIADDYKYFNDDADEFRENGQGTLLPLWKFSYDLTNKLAVTSSCWSKKYPDLFAVSFGSFNFSKQTAGALLLYSLKNPSFPEHIRLTNAGIMSIDIHPREPYLICAGFYNGEVAVFNTKSSQNSPEYVSTPSSGGQHTAPVWQVKWQNENLDGLMNFSSVSADGNIANWVLVKNELVYTKVLGIKNIDAISDLDDKMKDFSLAAATALSFHTTQPNLFLAGTEEGKIFKCSQAYTSRYLDVIPAHHMTVEEIQWSPFHPDIFITCSQDWKLKMWDHNYSSQPLFVYELGASVGACCWAVHSSTVFAAVTDDGKIHVFDISQNKFEALVTQVISQKKKTKLTSVEFNPKEPVLIVGDDRGFVTTLKISPNLRKIPKMKKGQVYELNAETEKAKLEKIAELVRTT
jgi:dynein intermediate chain 1